MVQRKYSILCVDQNKIVDEGCKTWMISIFKKGFLNFFFLIWRCSIYVSKKKDRRETVLRKPKDLETNEFEYDRILSDCQNGNNSGWYLMGRRQNRKDQDSEEHINQASPPCVQTGGQKYPTWHRLGHRNQGPLIHPNIQGVSKEYILWLLITCVERI